MAILDLPLWFYRVFALMLGLLFGSFLNVVIHRLPLGQSVVRPASHCPNCGTPIPFYRNIPVMTWALQRGRAACCGVRISPRYVLVELAGGVLALAVLETQVFSLPPQTSLLHGLMVFLADCTLAWGLLAAAFIDLEHMIIPDEISIGGTVLGIATASFRAMTFGEALGGAVIGFLVVWFPFDFLYQRLRGMTGMGLGDAKLLMLAGAWFGWEGALLVLGAGAIQGTVVALPFLLLGKAPSEPEAVVREREELHAQLERAQGDERARLEAEIAADPLGEAAGEGVGQARIAFGPFLILATLELLLIGREPVLSWLLTV
ncbi:MAG: prepilin peptidase [Myxococcota bacterium]